ncbi:MAG: pilus assembly protein PilM [Planctomycetota bacterium]|nr:MAG: pilus assembly protein PilM [Planctomycetota bacterium]
MFEKTALGIDISDKTISLAVLKRSKNSIELVKAANGPVPDGAVDDGNIKDPAKLSKAIKELKSRANIRTRRAAASLIANPTVMQILDCPDQVATGLGQYVRNEVEHYAALTGEQAAMDFCTIGSGLRGANMQVLVFATTRRRVTDIAKVCHQARCSVRIIEPPLLSCIRAFYAKQITPKYDCYVLIALLHGSVLNLCVFKDLNFSFIRTKDIGEEMADGDKLCRWLAEEIDEVIKFYNVEIPEGPKNWEITVVADSKQLPQDAEESLKAKVQGTEVQVRTPENAYQDISLVGESASSTTSPVAVGLAMRLLGIKESNLTANLLTQESLEMETIKKDALITANAIGVILLVMLLAVVVVNYLTKRVNKNVFQVKQTQLSHKTLNLLRQQESLDRQIKELSGNPFEANKILAHPNMEWPVILRDIKNRTPKTVRINELLNKESSKVSLKGFALSYEAIRLFVDLLNHSEYIDSASLVETEKYDSGYIAIMYTIDCFFATKGT